MEKNNKSVDVTPTKIPPFLDRLSSHYVGIAFASIVGLFFLGFFSSAPNSPFFTSGDFLITFVVFKQLITGGWLTDIPSYGFPWSMDFSSFPMLDFTEYAIIKSFSPFVHGDIFITLYLYTATLTLLNILAAYLLIAYIEPKNVIQCVLFALLVSLVAQVMRSTGHNFLYAFYGAYLGIYLTLRAILPKRRHRGWLLADVTSVAVVALSGMYYCFMGMFLLAIWGVVAAVARRWNEAARCALTCVLIAASLLGATALLYPRVLFDDQTTLPRRVAIEQAYYGLRVADALLHVPFQNRATSTALAFRDGNEGTDAWGGPVLAITSLILPLFLLIWTAAKGRVGSIFSPDTENEEKVALFSATNVTLIMLFALPYGYGYIFNILFTPVIRAQNRFGIVLIAMSGLFLVLGMFRVGRNRMASTTALLAGLVLLNAAPRWRMWPHLMKATHADMNELELANAANHSIAVSGARSVLQLPAAGFPEVPKIGDFEPYQHLELPLLYEDKPAPRWSYGALAGSVGSGFNTFFFNEPDLGANTTNAFCVGYDAIVIEKKAYGPAQSFGPFAGWTALREDQRRIVLHRDDSQPLDCKRATAYQGRSVITLGALFLSGWHSPEPWGIWARTNKARLLIPFTKDDLCQQVSFTLHSLVPEITIQANADRFTETVHLNRESPTAKVSFRVSAPKGQVPGAREIDFVADGRPKSPRSVGINRDDHRLITFGLSALEISRCGEPE